MLSIVVLYSTGCPKCRVLKAKLDEAHIEYIENNDVQEMIDKGFTTSPILCIDDKTYNFLQAIELIKNKEI